MTKNTLRERAVYLRKAGFSYRYIKKEVDVSLGTLSEWLSKIPYTPNIETIERIGKARVASMLSKYRMKEESIRSAHEQAKSDIGNISKRDIFMLGIGIYIGEGSKTHNIIRLVNSDPRIIRFSINWFKQVCGFQNDNFRIRLHLYPDSDVQKCLSFWSKELNMALPLFQKTQIDIRGDKKVKKIGKLPFGTAHLSIRGKGKKEHGVFLSRRINGWIKEVLK